MVRFSVDHPKAITALMIAVTLGLAALMPRVHVDTDPENMLSGDDPARVFHDEMKREFAVHDMIVLGIVNDRDPDGVFNPASLRKVYELTEFAKTLRGEGLEPGGAPGTAAESGGEGGAGAPPPPPSAAAPQLPPPLPGAEPEGGTGAGQGEQEKGVVLIDLLAPSTVDKIEQGAPGTVQFSYLMSEPLPSTREQALAVRQGALDNPLLNGTLVSSDGQAACIYLPITDKDISYKVSQRLQEKTAELGGPEQYHITGLPVAEDTFGHEMFVQMAISAPLAMLVIFLLMLAFFRKPILIISPMIIALVSVICTMGLLIGLGYTVHIMSSMIPIFIMPIAVLDAIHILSEFFDSYQATRNRRETMLAVMRRLFVPMLYTSLTSAAGFASLALTPIPPVQVFGVFVAFGIMTAWVLTVTFVPAYVMFIPERRLANFGVSHAEEAPSSLLTRLLHRVGDLTFRRAKLIVTGAFLVLAVAGYGISRIRINDNPTKWFVENHPIRVADRVLNRHFAGTYQAYLALTPTQEARSVQETAGALRERIRQKAEDYKAKYPDEPAEQVFKDAIAIVDSASADAGAADKLFSAVVKQAEAKREAASLDDSFAWDEVVAAVQAEQLLSQQPLKRPDLLRYIGRLQQALVEPAGGETRPIVGKSNSVVDIIKKVHKELRGEESAYAVPETSAGVANCLLQFQNSHTPDDLWHFVTPDYKRANLWLQLKSGDNRDMERVVAQVDSFLAQNPPPVALEHRWFGLTYINVVWQRKMVTGMLQAFAGSFLVVLVLMTVLFHSALWGLLSMIPLTLTIALIYGLIGLVGKDYDMPVAVLSSLTLGLAVDFAIHFLARSRHAVQQVGSWERARGGIFGEPARAISRNAIVVAIGFLPLLAAPLVPYKTVGLFMGGILAMAAVCTLLLLPALLNLLSGPLFARLTVARITCNCAACVLASVAAVIFLALTFHSHFHLGWNTLTWFAVIAIPVLVFACGLISRRRACRMLAGEQAASDQGKEE